MVAVDQGLHEPGAAIAHVVGILHDHGVDVAVDHVPDGLGGGVENHHGRFVANAALLDDFDDRVGVIRPDADQRVQIGMAVQGVFDIFQSHAQIHVIAEVLGLRDFGTGPFGGPPWR